MIRSRLWIVSLFVLGCTSPAPDEVVRTWIDGGASAETNTCKPGMHPTYLLGMELTDVEATVEVVEQSATEALVRYTVNGNINNESISTDVAGVEIRVNDVSISDYSRSGEVALQRDGKHWRIVCNEFSL